MYMKAMGNKIVIKLNILYQEKCFSVQEFLGIFGFYILRSY